MSCCPAEDTAVLSHKNPRLLFFSGKRFSGSRRRPGDDSERQAAELGITSFPSPRKNGNGLQLPLAVICISRGSG